MPSTGEVGARDMQAKIQLLELVAETGSVSEALRNAHGATYNDFMTAASRAVDEARKASDQRLFKTLREWRRELAQERGLPAYMIAPDRTLVDIAARRPQTREQLRDVWGLGVSRCEAFGDDILALVAAAGGREDALDPLTSSLLEMLADGHEIWQVIDAYPHLNVASVASHIAEALQALGYSGKNDEATPQGDTTGGPTGSRPEVPRDSNTKHSNSTGPSRSTRERPRRIGTCGRCGEETQEPWHRLCARCFDVVDPRRQERRDAETRERQVEERYRKLRLRLGRQNYSEDT